MTLHKVHAAVAATLAFVLALISPARSEEWVDAFDAELVGTSVSATVTQPDGKLIIAGKFKSIRGVVRENIARFNADGTLDMAFQPKVNHYILTMALQADGKILIGGSFTGIQQDSLSKKLDRRYLARLNADGSVDAAFDPRPDQDILSLALQRDGRIIAGGKFQTLQPNRAAAPLALSYLTRLHPNGTPDAAFDPRPDGIVWCVALQKDGKVLAGGYFGSLQPAGTAKPTPRRSIARINPDGTLDAGFDPHAGGPVANITVQPDGKILLGGWFNSLQPNGAPKPINRGFIARVHPGGGLDMEFNPNADKFVGKIVVQPDGKIVFGGLFETLQPNGQALPNSAPGKIPRRFVARVNPDGSVDPDFDPSLDNGIHSIDLQPDGKILIGGGFNSLSPNGASPPIKREHFVRLNPDLKK